MDIFFLDTPFQRQSTLNLQIDPSDDEEYENQINSASYNDNNNNSIFKNVRTKTATFIRKLFISLVIYTAVRHNHFSYRYSNFI